MLSSPRGGGVDKQMRLRWLTAGESHGSALLAVVEGMCAGLAIGTEDLIADLRARSEGAGRSARQQGESVEPVILSGVRNGVTTGAPIALLLANEVKGEDGFEALPDRSEHPSRTVPRPGHADLAGCLKRPGLDLRDIAERASARETAARTMAGALAAKLLGELGVRIASRVVRVGAVDADGPFGEPVPSTPFGTGDPDAERRMKRELAEAESQGEGLGGIFEVQATNVPAGLGDYTQWDLRLDGRLSQALMSIPAVKAVEIGDGIAIVSVRSSEARDAIVMSEGKLMRPTNRAGGIEGGVSNGMPIRARAYVKPIPGVSAPIASVDLATGEPAPAGHERHDTCVVRAAAVVGRAMTALVLADALLTRTGGDTLDQVRAALARLGR